MVIFGKTNCKKSSCFIHELVIVIDKILGSSFRDRLPLHLFDTDRSFDSANTDTKIRLFRPEAIASQIWQVQRWQSQLESS